MATRAVAPVATQLDSVVVVREWTGLLLGDDGAWLLLAHYGDKCLHVFGTWGGATLAFEGTNETGTPTNPAPLSDPGGVVISLSSTTTIKQVLENPLYVRPRVVGGDGTTSLTARLVTRH